jgi:hypothetical protein
MYHELIMIDDDLFHRYGFVCSAMGKTPKELNENMEKKFMKNFTSRWRQWGGGYSKKKGWYGRDNRYGDYETMKTMDDVIYEFGGRKYTTKNGNFLKSNLPDEMH